MEELRLAGFPHELGRLLMRCKDGRNMGQGRQVKMSNHSAAPKAVIKGGLCEEYAIAWERFASL